MSVINKILSCYTITYSKELVMEAYFLDGSSCLADDYGNSNITCTNQFMNHGNKKKTV